MTTMTDTTSRRGNPGAPPSVDGTTVTGLIGTVSTATLRPVVVDLYRDIHKGIRTELFDTTRDAARLDPQDGPGRVDLAARVSALAALLADHARHEDGHIDPVLAQTLPELAASVARDHANLEASVVDLVQRAGSVGEAVGGDPRFEVHSLSLDLALFTSAYLRHQDLEERVVGPALEEAVGPDEMLRINGAIVESIPPPEMARALALILPAMNIEDRSELLGAMRDGAPTEVFDQVWSLAVSVLEPADTRRLGARLGLA